MNTFIHSLTVDLKFQTALVVIFVDFALGVLAAFKLGTFRLSYIADFARNDLLEKLVPWAVIYIAAKFAGEQQLVIPHVDVDVAANAVYVAIIGAWTGSILSSLRELALPAAARPTIMSVLFGPENPAPKG